MLLRFQSQIENDLLLFFCAGPRLVSISPKRDVSNLHSQRTVKYSEPIIRLVQMSDFFYFFLGGEPRGPEII